MSLIRAKILLLCFFLIGLIVIARLYYWQILSAEELQAMAREQHVVKLEVPASRGEIFSSDHFPLVSNQAAYLLYANLPQLSQTTSEISPKLASIFFEEQKETSPAAEIDQESLEGKIFQQLDQEGLVWVALKHHLKEETKEEIEALQIKGLGFEEESLRSYPESSLSAHLLGFTGADYHGHPKGYFGLEGYYDLELKGQAGLLFQERDVSGQPILVGDFYERPPQKGRDLILSLDRAIQFMVEEKLKKGLDKYGAISGSVIILKPDGAVLAMASLPSYEPSHYYDYQKENFVNPVVAASFEPGSVLKPVIMAAALNEGAVKPDTRCDRCSGPRQIGSHVIRTWDDRYYPNCTATEIIEHSDNVGMVFVAEELSQAKLVEYLKKFGLGSLTEIDLQEEATPELRPDDEWKEIDTATTAFGQGIAVTPIQLVRAMAAIANGGQLVKPYVVAKVAEGDKEMEVKPQIVRRVVSQETAEKVKAMMVNAVEKGEAKWTKLKGFKIAGKTGTAQIPVAGHYDEEKTIASFAGFAPADEPKFVMLVTLREPQSSPWAAETAAPLWFNIAKDLLYYFKITPH